MEPMVELSKFEAAIVELRSKPLGQYCEADISQLQCDIGAIKCALGKTREKIVRSANCVGYNWELKRKPAMIIGFDKFLNSLDEEIQKLEQSMNKRKMEIESTRTATEQKYANKYLPGWEPDGWTPTDE